MELLGPVAEAVLSCRETKKITLLILSQSELWSHLDLYYFTLVVLLFTGNIGLQADETVWPGPEGDEDEV